MLGMHHYAAKELKDDIIKSDDDNNKDVKYNQTETVMIRENNEYLYWWPGRREKAHACRTIYEIMKLD